MSKTRLDAWRIRKQPFPDSVRRCKLETGGVEDNSGLGKAIRYFDKHFAGLARFCTQEGAPIDNNIMERYIKLVVRNRKNANFIKHRAVRPSAMC
ncbi:transposase [Ketobacter sp. MCCC 1A13808]|uniref:IS66 family transposase n=1 Tax=Ketobacter sp. MCCC 1A13808 TaxID=2602738 RepID=UPI0013282CF8|nr:transposase [Ketobacter sp. MCCC 1A13808]